MCCACHTPWKRLTPQRIILTTSALYNRAKKVLRVPCKPVPLRACACCSFPSSIPTPPEQQAPLASSALCLDCPMLAHPPPQSIKVRRLAPTPPPFIYWATDCVLYPLRMQPRNTSKAAILIGSTGSFNY